MNNVRVRNVIEDPLLFTLNGSDVYIDHKYRIVESDILGTNGVIHIIDKFMVPDKGIYYF